MQMLCVGQWQVINFWVFSEDGEYFSFAFWPPTFSTPPFCLIQEGGTNLLSVIARISAST